MGIQDPSKINYKRLNVVLVMGSPVRPCIALCWVHTGLLTARAAGITYFFLRQPQCPGPLMDMRVFSQTMAGVCGYLGMGRTDITKQRMPAKAKSKPAT